MSVGRAVCCYPFLVQPTLLVLTGSLVLQVMGIKLVDRYITQEYRVDVQQVGVNERAH